MKRPFEQLITVVLIMVLFTACGGSNARSAGSYAGRDCADIHTDSSDSAGSGNTNDGTANTSSTQQPGSHPVSDGCSSAAVNVALHATVTLNGGSFFTGGWGSGKAVDANTIVDGVFLPRSNQWDQGPVWWDSNDGVDRSITLDLGGVYKIECLVVQADDNDAYILYYHDAARDTWQPAWNVPNYDAYPDSSSWGMQTRPYPDNNEGRYVLPRPIVADALMIKGDMQSGDKLFAISEVQAFGIPVSSVPGEDTDDRSSGGGATGTDIHLPGYGTATIDGVMNQEEWAKAASIDFQANIPSYDGGGTTPATLYFMNDGTNLYFAVKIARSSFGGATNPVLEFDNNNNGIREDGDDGFGMSVGIYEPVTFFDIYRYTCPGAPAGSAGCSAMDTETTHGILPAGTNDGKAAATNDGKVTIIELSHPLNSGDSLHDFSLKPGDTVGFRLSLRLFSLTPACNEGPSCYADTYIPAAGTGDYRQISVVSSESSMR